MKVKDILNWASENDIFDLVSFINQKLKEKTLSQEDDENKIWILMQKGRYGCSGSVNTSTKIPIISEPVTTKKCGCIPIFTNDREYDGLVINKQRAESTEKPCHESRRIFKHGIIGPLNKKQEKQYCTSQIPLRTELGYNPTNEIKLKIRRIGQDWIIESLGKLSPSQENIIDSIRLTPQKTLKTFTSLASAQDTAKQIASKLGISPDNIIVQSISFGNFRKPYNKVEFRIKRLPEYNEWKVAVYIDNKLDEAKSYYTNDKYDAEITMKMMEKESKEHPESWKHSGQYDGLIVNQTRIKSPEHNSEYKGIKMETPYLHDEVRRIIEKYPTLRSKDLILHIKYKHPELKEEDIKKIIDEVRK